MKLVSSLLQSPFGLCVLRLIFTFFFFPFYAFGAIPSCKFPPLKTVKNCLKRTSPKMCQLLLKTCERSTYLICLFQHRLKTADHRSTYHRYFQTGQSSCPILKNGKQALD